MLGHKILETKFRQMAIVQAYTSCILCTPIEKEKGSILHAKNLNLVFLLQSNSLYYSYYYVYVSQAFCYAVIMCQKDFWIVACSIKMIHNRRYKEQRAKFFFAKTVTTLKKFLFYILNECLKIGRYNFLIYCIHSSISLNQR